MNLSVKATGIDRVIDDLTNLQSESPKGGVTEKMRELREQGWFCVGTSLHNAAPLSEIRPADRMVFVVGNEREGVSEEVLRETDVSCRIEMENYDSLNVSVAAGIVLYRFRL